MAKRHPSLVSLSHDHHHGLALALRLRQGRRALLTDGWTHDRREQARRVHRFHEEELRVHFRAEEEVLFPHMLKHVSSATRIVPKLLQEHFAIESLISETATAADEALPEVLERLGELLERHIRTEERELFPLFQDGVPEDVAQAIGRQIEEVRASLLAGMRAGIHVSAGRVINAKTEALYRILQAVDSYPQWWPGRAFCCVIDELQENKLIGLRLEGDGIAGSARWTMTDCRGGRRVEFEADLDWTSTAKFTREYRAGFAETCTRGVDTAMANLARLVGAGKVL